MAVSILIQWVSSQETVVVNAATASEFVVFVSCRGQVGTFEPSRSGTPSYKGIHLPRMPFCSSMCVQVCIPSLMETYGVYLMCDIL